MNVLRRLREDVMDAKRNAAASISHGRTASPAVVPASPAVPASSELPCSGSDDSDHQQDEEAKHAKKRDEGLIKAQREALRRANLQQARGALEVSQQHKILSLVEHREARLRVCLAAEANIRSNLLAMKELHREAQKAIENVRAAYDDAISAVRQEYASSLAELQAAHK
jgi:hypothetical protein